MRPCLKKKRNISWGQPLIHRHLGNALAQTDKEQIDRHVVTMGCRKTDGRGWRNGRLRDEDIFMWSHKEGRDRIGNAFSLFLTLYSCVGWTLK